MACAGRNAIHPLILEWQARPDHLWSQPPKTEEPFSTPRSWHMLSDAMTAYGDALGDAAIEALAFGCLTPHTPRNSRRSSSRCAAAATSR